ncbi:MAG: tetratricopeptide repeat protein [Myxococcales bacterium]|nr:tetratricopeptide repeat protein [Myxococcales bacterium]
MSQSPTLPREARVRRLLDTAESHARNRRAARAVFFYRKVLALAGSGEYERELAHLRLADLHLGRGEPQGAVHHVGLAIKLGGQGPDYALLLGRALLELGRLDEAAAALHQALQDGPLRVEAFTLLGDVLAAQGDRTGAAALIRHAAEGRPSDLALRRRLRELSDA